MLLLHALRTHRRLDNSLGEGNGRAAGTGGHGERSWEMTTNRFFSQDLHFALQ